MSDTPDTPAGDGADDKGPIPYERFAATRRELADAKSRAAAPLALFPTPTPVKPR